MNPQETVMKNKKKAISGVCPICGTKLFRFGSEGEPDAGAPVRLRVAAARVNYSR